MPPKKNINKDILISGAVNLIRKGNDKLSARLVAKECGCSVVPIYSEFENMDQLEVEVISKLNYMLINYPIELVEGNDFLNKGLSYIAFATEEKKLFSWLFKADILNNENIKNILKPFLNESYTKLRSHPYTSSWTDDEVKQIVEDLWVYTHGYAVLVNSGVVKNKDRNELINCLRRVFASLAPKKGEKIWKFQEKKFLQTTKYY